MKKLLKTSVIITLTLIFNSCSNNSLPDSNETSESKIKIEDFLKTNYGIIATDLGNGNLEFIYPDGLKLDIKNLNGRYLMSGSKISNKPISLKMNKEKSNLITSVEFTSVFSKNSILNNSNLHKNKNGNYLKRTYGQCFKDEWNAFCDGFISCVAQVTNPQGIAAAVAIACGIEAVRDNSVYIEPHDLDLEPMHGNELNEIKLIEIEL